MFVLVILFAIDSDNYSNSQNIFRLLYFVLIMNDGIPAGNTKPTGEDAPEGFTKNYLTVFKGYFCKYVCQKSWDSFDEEEVLLNEELRTNARATKNQCKSNIQ